MVLRKTQREKWRFLSDQHRSFKTTEFLEEVNYRWQSWGDSRDLNEADDREVGQDEEVERSLTKGYKGS